MTWYGSGRSRETARGLAGEEGADLEGLKPGGAFHMSCSIVKLRIEEEERRRKVKNGGMVSRVRDVGEMEVGDNMREFLNL